MTKKNSQLNAQELQLIERLREHPELMERFQSILEISANADGPVKRADEVEGLLIEKMRRLGNTTMGSWEASAEKRLRQQLEQKDASATDRKKTLTWWCVFGLIRVADRVWRTSQKQYLRLLPEAIGVTARGRSLRLERVLTDFGCEHSFIHAADRVREHYGFEISASAVREATFKHAQRAQDMLEQQ